MRPLMTYLHEHHFNVYAPPGAGHAFHRSRLPSTRLKQDATYDAARSVLLHDPLVKDYLQKMQELAAMFPPDVQEYAQVLQRVTTLLQQHLPSAESERVLHALRLLSPMDHTPGFEHQLHELFESDHMRYASHPVERLAEVCALPGPMHVIGYSLGGVQAMNMIAGTGMVDKLVLLAPYIGTRTSGDVDVSLCALGALDLYLLPFPLWTVSACHLTAASVAAKCVQSEQVVKAVKQVPCFCVVSEGDECCDPRLVQRFFERVDREGSCEFVYPEEMGLGHTIVPGKENRFSRALMKEVWRFLVLDKVDKEWLVTKDGDPMLPGVDEERFGKELGEVE